MTIQHVLLVDDDPSYCYALQRALAVAGVTAATAVSGDEALRLLESGTAFGALTVDIRMGPGEPSGFDLAREVQARRSGLPVVYVTAFDVDPAAADTALGPIVSKSLGMDAAVTAISGALARSDRAWRPADLEYALSHIEYYEEAARAASDYRSRKQAIRLAQEMRRLAEMIRAELAAQAGDPPDQLDG